MATPSTVQRATETGDQFRTFTSGGVHSQGASLVDEAGAHQGVTGNGLVVAVEGTPNVAISGTANVAITGQPIQTTSAAETFSKFKTTGFQDEADNIATGACELRHVRIIPDPTVTETRYAMFFNSTTAAAQAGNAPDWWMVIPPNGEASEQFGKGEMAFATACSIAISSTPATLTLTTANEALIFGVYV